MMPSNRLSDQLIALTTLTVIWWLASSVANNPLLPSPVAVWETFLYELQSEKLLPNLTVTMQRVAISFVFAMLIGGITGVIMARSRLANRILDPVLVILLNIPALVVIILLYIWFGLVEVAAVSAVIINKLPNVAVTLREGGRIFDQQLEEMARLYKFGFLQKITELWWPQLFPYVMIATRSGLALIWKIVLVVELLGRSDGVGFQLHIAFQLFDVATILAYSLSFIAVIQLIEWFILQPLEKHANRWRRGEINV